MFVFPDLQICLIKVLHHHFGCSDQSSPTQQESHDDRLTNSLLGNIDIWPHLTHKHRHTPVDFSRYIFKTNYRLHTKGVKARMHHVQVMNLLAWFPGSGVYDKILHHLHQAITNKSTRAEDTSLLFRSYVPVGDLVLFLLMLTVSQHWYRKDKKNKNKSWRN